MRMRWWRWSVVWPCFWGLQSKLRGGAIGQSISMTSLSRYGARAGTTARRALSALAIWLVALSTKKCTFHTLGVVLGICSGRRFRAPPSTSGDTMAATPQRLEATHSARCARLKGHWANVAASGLSVRTPKWRRASKGGPSHQHVPAVTRCLVSNGPGCAGASRPSRYRRGQGRTGAGRWVPERSDCWRSGHSAGRRSRGCHWWH